MASMHEMQKTDTSMVDTPGHDKPQTFGAHMQHVGTQVKETMQDVGTQVKETMQAAGTQAYEQGRESLQDLNRTLEAQIRERPLQALLVAGGIGALLGLLWRRS
jgi:ElaB/YqjD/DUF883 family membrane-anchored ribosome-binding protein